MYVEVNIFWGVSREEESGNGILSKEIMSKYRNFQKTTISRGRAILSWKDLVGGYWVCSKTSTRGIV